jgi:hypothetical protein
VFSDLYLNYQKRLRGKPLLWPVWIWSLHVPDNRRGGLNLLARTVLRLHQVGCEDPQWIADHIGVDAELVRYIVQAELVANGLLDRRRQITDAGKKALGGEDEDLHQRAVLMFQSAESGELWPRQRSSLPEIEPVNPQDKFPRFLEDRDSGRTLSPFALIPPTRSVPLQPSEAAIQRALRQDHLARRLERHRGTSDRNLDDEPVYAIKFIDPQPRPAWVLCGIYRGDENEHLWLVTDPLGRSRAATWMRKEVFEASRRVNGLAKSIGDFLGETDEKEDWETYRRREDEAVRFQVFEQFPNAGRIPGLEERLIELLRSRATVAAEARQARSEEIGTVLIQGQRTLEQCLQWSLKYWPLAHPGNRLSYRMNERDLQNALRCVVPALPERFVREVRVKPSKVFGALRYGTGSLRQYLVGVLLSLVDHPNHPFRPIATDGDLMLRILELSQERDAVGHADNNNGLFEHSRALAHADTALEVVQKFIEGNRN